VTTSPRGTKPFIVAVGALTTATQKVVPGVQEIGLSDEPPLITVKPLGKAW
jgi:hypothetical protein